MSEKTIVEIRDRKFVIHPLSARDGSFILNQAMTKKLPFNIEAPMPKLLPPDRPFLTEEDFHVIQDRALAPLTELVKVPGKDGEETTHERKVFVNGKLAPYMEGDLFVIEQLTAYSLLGTILPFFLDRPTDVPRAK